MLLPNKALQTDKGKLSCLLDTQSYASLPLPLSLVVSLTNMPQRYKGRLTEWRDDRGFGFIAPALGGDRVFVHIKSFANRSRRPAGEELVTYELKRGPKGRLQGVNVAFSGDRTSRSSAVGRGTGALILATVFIALIAGAVAVGSLPLYTLGLYLAGSGISYFAYAWDKRAAKNSRWRIAENTLHLIALLGGWPGAVVAQKALRHKTKEAAIPDGLLGYCGTELWRSALVLVASGGFCGVRVNQARQTHRAAELGP